MFKKIALALSAAAFVALPAAAEAQGYYGGYGYSYPSYGYSSGYGYPGYGYSGYGSRRYKRKKS